MNPKADLKGKRFGALLVIREHDRQPGERVSWDCVCDCGNECVVTTSKLTSGYKTSCGCGAYSKPATAKTKQAIDYLATYDQKPYTNGSSPVRGVSYDHASGKWIASITHRGKRRFLGRYKDFDDAVAARKQGEREIIDGLRNEETRH